MCYSDDPVKDFDQWDQEQQRKLERLPACRACGEHIQQENAVRLEGYYYCDACLDDMRISIDVD